MIQVTTTIHNSKIYINPNYVVRVAPHKPTGCWILLSTNNDINIQESVEDVVEMLKKSVNKSTT